MNVEKELSFDTPRARDFTVARQTFVETFLRDVREQIDLRSAVDVGCGVGYFSKFLSERGLRVVAVDGREENTTEGKRRFPDVTFITRDAEALSSADLGTFDLVLCFGLLYHLENPFRVIRNFHALTDKLLLVEGMCVPSSLPTMELLDEGTAEDQALSYVAFYPSESCLIKMLYRAGFPFVYRFERLPADDLYKGTSQKKRLRTMLAASKVALTARNLTLAKEPLRMVLEFGPWKTPLSRFQDFLKSVGIVFTNVGDRMRWFLARPWGQKWQIVSWYMRRVWNRN